MFWIWLYLGATIFTVVVAIPWVNGVMDFYIAYRFRKEAKGKVDLTAFFLNWIAFKWSWTNYWHKIVEAMPFFEKDLTETFGIREDDGRIT